MEYEPKSDRKEEGLDLNRINERVVLDGILGNNQSNLPPQVEQDRRCDRTRDNLSGIYEPTNRDGLYSD